MCDEEIGPSLGSRCSDPAGSIWSPGVPCERNPPKTGQASRLIKTQVCRDRLLVGRCPYHRGREWASRKGWPSAHSDTILNEDSPERRTTRDGRSAAGPRCIPGPSPSAETRRRPGREHPRRQFCRDGPIRPAVSGVRDSQFRPVPPVRQGQQFSPAHHLSAENRRLHFPPNTGAPVPGALSPPKRDLKTATGS